LNAEIIAVGSELLTPQRLDTNSLYLTDRLNALGVEVTTKTIVGDNLDRLAAAVRLAASRTGIVIITGGLGPTEDDLTREAVAQALGRKLVYHPEIAAGIEQRFARLKRRMAENNRRQAFIVEGAAVLPNDRGTAPGQWIDDRDVSVLLLPGPPGELEAMFQRQCMPRLERRVPRQVIRAVCFRVAGMPESDLDQLISPVYKRYLNPATTILAGAGDIQVHLRARTSTEEEAAALLTEVAAQIEVLLGDRVYSRSGDSLEAVVGQMFKQAGATLAVAESMTGGMLAERITSVPGSSAYFLGGFLTYTNAMKAELLGIGEAVLAEFGAVSRETAELMAQAARRRTGATYAVSVTGIAGPDTGGGNAPAGTTYIGVAGPEGCEVTARQFLGDRTRVRSFATQIALDLLRRRLQALTLAARLAKADEA
jgi:nicotinamide-nucleotide amidase